MNPPVKSPYRTTVCLANVEEQTCSDGGLTRLSPIEIDHGVLFSIKEAIDNKADDSILQRWKTLLLTWPFTCEVVQPGDPQKWRAQNLREQMVDAGDTVKLSTRQRAMGVVGFKLEKEKEKQALISSPEIAKMYASSLVLARSSEAVSATFVDSSLTVHKRILHDPTNMALLEWCDEQCSGTADVHPFASIYTLQGVCDRTSGNVQTNWALQILVDHLRMEYIDIGCFSVRKIKDQRESYINALSQAVTKLCSCSPIVQERLRGSKHMKDVKHMNISLISSTFYIDSSTIPPTTYLETQTYLVWAIVKYEAWAKTHWNSMSNC